MLKYDFTGNHLAPVRQLLLREIDTLALWIGQGGHYARRVEGEEGDARFLRMVGHLRGIVVQASEQEIDTQAAHICELLTAVHALLDTRGSA